MVSPVQIIAGWPCSLLASPHPIADPRGVPASGEHGADSLRRVVPDQDGRDLIRGRPTCRIHCGRRTPAESPALPPRTSIAPASLQLPVTIASCARVSGGSGCQTLLTVSMYSGQPTVLAGSGVQRDGRATRQFSLRQ
jgi:hypothetical protein